MDMLFGSASDGETSRTTGGYGHMMSDKRPLAAKGGGMTLLAAQQSRLMRLLSPWFHHGAPRDNAR